MPPDWAIPLLFSLYTHALAQWLLHMHEDARQLRLGLSSEHLNLVDEHAPQLCLVLDQEVREALNIWRACSWSI